MKENKNDEHHSVACGRLQGLRDFWTFTITGTGTWENCNAWNKEESGCLFAYTWIKIQGCPPIIHSNVDGVTLKILFMGLDETYLILSQNQELVSEAGRSFPKRCLLEFCRPKLILKLIIFFFYASIQNICFFHY